MLLFCNKLPVKVNGLEGNSPPDSVPPLKSEATLSSVMSRKLKLKYCIILLLDVFLVFKYAKFRHISEFRLGLWPGPC